MGNTLTSMSDSFPPAPKWSSDEVPDLSGKVMLITGANVGIGKETARVLLKHNARVYLACRNAEKAQAAAEDLKRLTGKTDDDVRIIILDLSNLATIKTGVESFLQHEAQLNVLVNNGGVMWAPKDQFTVHGHDMQFGTNVLGHFYLTQLLLPALIASAKSSRDDGHARVVNVASTGHLFAPVEKKGGPIIYQNTADCPGRTKSGQVELYGMSKAGNILFSNALARKYGNQGIVSISLHPGNIKTDLLRHASPSTSRILNLFLDPVERGALTSLYAATSPEAAELNGKYLRAYARLTSPRRDMENIADQEKLWSWLEGEVKKFAP